MTTKRAKNVFGADVIALTMAFFCVFVFCSLIVSVAYYSNKNEIYGTITLGEIDFSIGTLQTENLVVLPNDYVQKTVFVCNSRNEKNTDFKGLCDIYLRFNINVFVNEDKNDSLKEQIVLFSSDKFYNDNGTMYYLGVLRAGEKVNLCETINFDEKISNTYQGKNIKIEFNVDAVQADNDAYKEVWQNYPIEWQRMIENS